MSSSCARDVGGQVRPEEELDLSEVTYTHVERTVHAVLALMVRMHAGARDHHAKRIGWLSEGQKEDVFFGRPSACNRSPSAVAI